MKAKRSLRQLVEAACQDAYLIGHAHAGNARRALNGQPSLRDHEGWLHPANRLLRQLRRRAKEKS